VVLTAVIAATAAFAPSRAGAEPTCCPPNQIVWHLPSAFPADNFHTENLEAFAKDVAQASEGKLAIQVHPDASLLPASAIKSAVRIGQAQMGETLLSLHENEQPMFGIDVLPFLATSYEAARKLWAVSREVLERKLAAQGIMVLFTVPWAPNGIFADKEIKQVEDMKGLSWRVYNASTQRIGEIIGADPVNIQAADLRPALATGLLHAFMTSPVTGYDVRVWEKMGYFYDARAWIPKNITMANKAAFDALDRPTQEAVLKTAAAAEARGWRRSQEKATWYMQQLVAHGMIVTPPGPVLQRQLQEIGERLTGEWLMRAGAEGLSVIQAYRKLAM
jgi:TRAP-type C4-dicarboxylate transport system substrate-binding protein